MQLSEAVTAHFKVNIIQNLSFLTGEEKLASLLKSKNNVEIIYDTVVTSLIGDDGLTAIRLHNTKTNEDTEMQLDGMFVAIGLIPDNSVANGVVTLDEYGYIPSDENCLTDVSGIFVAGDCRTKKIRQIATAVSDGASAALAACKYIENK